MNSMKRKTCEYSKMLGHRHNLLLIDATFDDHNFDVRKPAASEQQRYHRARHFWEIDIIHAFESGHSSASSDTVKRCKPASRRACALVVTVNRLWSRWRSIAVPSGVRNSASIAIKRSTCLRSKGSPPVRRICGRHGLRRLLLNERFLQS